MIKPAAPEPEVEEPVKKPEPKVVHVAQPEPTEFKIETSKIDDSDMPTPAPEPTVSVVQAPAPVKKEVVHKPIQKDETNFKIETTEATPDMLKDLVGDTGAAEEDIVDETASIPALVEKKKQLVKKLPPKDPTQFEIVEDKFEFKQDADKTNLDSILGKIMGKVRPDMEETFVAADEDVEIKVYVKDKGSKTPFKEIYTMDIPQQKAQMVEKPVVTKKIVAPIAPVEKVEKELPPVKTEKVFPVSAPVSVV